MVPRIGVSCVLPDSTKQRLYVVLADSDKGTVVKTRTRRAPWRPYDVQLPDKQDISCTCSIALHSR